MPTMCNAERQLLLLLSSLFYRSTFPLFLIYSSSHQLPQKKSLGDYCSRIFRRLNALPVTQPMTSENLTIMQKYIYKKKEETKKNAEKCANLNNACKFMCTCLLHCPHLQKELLCLLHLTVCPPTVQYQHRQH